MSVERTCKKCGEEFDAGHGMCPACTPYVSTEIDGPKVKGRIVSETLSSTKLMKILVESDDSSVADGPTIVRHANRVSPLNDAAKKFLGR
jgi:hypothetical protein